MLFPPRSGRTRDQGQKRVQRSVRVQKRILDNSTKKWRDTDYWFRDDLPRVQFVVQKAYEYIALKEDEEGRAPTVAV